MMDQHFESLRAGMLEAYKTSQIATHKTVAGSLREGFVRGILQGHLPATASWATGQIVGHAPNFTKSGQLDVILHSGQLPQLFLHDGLIRVIPADACIAVVEVKSQLTTGDVKSDSGTSSIAGSMASLVLAKSVPQSAASSSPVTVPFSIFAFTSGVSAEKIAKSVSEYLGARGIDLQTHWPDSIVVLGGAKKTEPRGFGLFRRDIPADLPPGTTDVSCGGYTAKKVLGPMALAVLVATLSNRVTRFGRTNFALERYFYSLPQASGGTVS